MGIEKESSKRGGYVGGFFQLFDWTAKSRKKLFSSKSDLPERLKQGKNSDGYLPMTHLYLMDEDETGAGTSIRGSSDYSCASSVTDDDGCGARAPGVVARLMGLDSLPTSSLSEPCSTPFLDTQSLQHASNHRKHFDYHEPQVMYPRNVLNSSSPPRSVLGMKPHKVFSRPIEKFHTELLPPKSAKSIPITHHKLLSPIKSPGFIPSKSAAHIMEAAAKIIEVSPQAAVKAKRPVIGNSSVHLKVRDLKDKLDVAQKVSPVGTLTGPLKVGDLEEKIEAVHKTSRLSKASTQRTVESNAAKYLKGQSLNNSLNGSVETPSLRAFPETEDGSSGPKNKGKSISLAIQAKVNVQRREGLNSSNGQGLVFQKDQSDCLSAQPFKSQPNPQKPLHRRTSINNASSVLRQNNQKQNCLSDKDKLASKPSVSSLQSRRTLSGNPSPLRHKTSGKNVGPKSGSRKLASEGTDSEKGISGYNKSNLPRKKRSIDGNLNLEKSQVLENMVIQNDQKATKSNQLTDKNFGWAEESKRRGMDVVSFTFTAPLTRSISGSGTVSHVGLQSAGACVDNGVKRLLLDPDSMKPSSMGYNIIGGDALSTLLEQKLKELSKSVESSSCNSVKVGSKSGSPLILQDPVCTLNAGGTNRFHKEDQNDSITDISSSSHDSDLISMDSTVLPRLKHLHQGVDDMEEYSSKPNEPNDATKLLDCRRPSPISVLEPSCSTDSCCSIDSGVTEESEPCSSMHSQEVLDFSPMKFYHADANADLLDSASSTSAGTVSRNKANTISTSDLVKSTTDWEIEYIKQMFLNLESMFKDFALGRAEEIINPHLFAQLVVWKGGHKTSAAEAGLDWKLLFDCVSECLDLKCNPYVNGGYRTWMKGMTMLKRKEKLAEEIYREISAWRGMGDSMVDELVDKDMSCQYGRWLDYEVDAFVLAAEVESQIFSSLINEVTADILRF